MAASHLRVYYGPEDDTAVAAPAHDTVNVPLDEIIPALVDAASSGRAWIQDFAEEQVTISTDLYEFILAYQHYRRPSA